MRASSAIANPYSYPSPATTWEETLHDPAFPPAMRSVPWARCARTESAIGMWIATWSRELGETASQVVAVSHSRTATALTLSCGRVYIVRGKEPVEYLTP